ncbi:MAG: oligopeptide transporter, OPT family [Bacteroidales bacterium]|nr:oligopeptide transporter, OPT family [Bacteroidales bacterium]
MSGKKYVPFVSSEESLPEMTLRAFIIGIVLNVVLGAANAYLGLKAGMTIAATYPAAVISLAILKALRGNILEENFARTVGSIGESVAAGAIFTLPAFYIAGLWVPFFSPTNYITASIILVAGGVLGILFVAILRRIMVEDSELPFPESIAAAEIHKAGRTDAKNSKYLFLAMGIGALVKLLGELKFFAVYWEKFIAFAKQTISGTQFSAKGGMLIGSPEISPAYLGVGYIIGPRLGALNFSGGILAWGILVPVILYFMLPSIDVAALQATLMANNPGMTPEEAAQGVTLSIIGQIARYIVKPIAIGGMLVSAFYTLYRMRKNLFAGITRSVNDVKKSMQGHQIHVPRTEKDLSLRTIMLGILGIAILTFFITFYFFKTTFTVALVSATVLIILAFFFAAISGYLVGIMGSSNNPISGLTLTGLVVTALIMVLIGVRGTEGIASVLGVAAIVCVAAAVAGEMLQDLKAGHILGGTPWKMQVGDVVGVFTASLVMFGVLVMLNNGDIAQGVREGYQGGFGSKNLPAPQAGLMALLSRGIVGGDMAWPLIVAGMLMATALILMQVKSPMLICVGIYLPLQTTFAIFIGGLIKGITDWWINRKNYSEVQKSKVENVGILVASGLIAGEALMGLVLAGFRGFNIFLTDYFFFFRNPSFIISLVVLALLALIMIWWPAVIGKKES